MFLTLPETRTTRTDQLPTHFDHRFTVAALDLLRYETCSQFNQGDIFPFLLQTGSLGLLLHYIRMYVTSP